VYQVIGEELYKKKQSQGHSLSKDEGKDLLT
jgi:hypothetical protein